MQGNYRKISVKMKLIDRDYLLWKKGFGEAVCVLETYKDKRSIYFTVSNLLPSRFLLADDGKAYHLLLMGVEDGQLIHLDFGPFHVNQKGEGSFFKKFSGAELACYTHCLLVAANSQNDETTVVYQGETPFFEKPEEDEPSREDSWQRCLHGCSEKNCIQAFTPEWDETQAVWYRMDNIEALPEVLISCMPLVEQYRHYIIGRKGNRCFVGIPGRFLQKEQPCRDDGLFLLWQPVRGGENFFEHAESMTRKQQEEIFGYWIAEYDLEKRILKSL